ncbi:hypothetical protein [Bradymonas sediminis]|uniref:hypothetical protein n=1 Tax=Bradymonas sediminis TaxID=1548548 RepID=UPI0010DE19DE|nr:hypothetical protein [Bradymonas sediminis]TDP73719.1 hypothetical protein DFR33_10551 [Bradymonas sediminis]
MKTKNWLVLLASCVALASAPLMGCGDDADPSNDNNVTENNTPTNNTPTNNTPTNNTPTNNTPTNNTPTNNTPTNNTPTNNTPTNNTPTNNTPTNNTPTNNTTSCVPADWFTGQAFAEGTDAHNGGNPLDAASVTLDDAGLQGIVDGVANGTPDENNDYIVTLDTPLTITGALVIATGRTDNDNTPDVIEGNDWLYLQDANTVVVLNAGPGKTAFPEGEAPTEAVKVGDTVSFSTSQIKSYAGVSQAVLVTDFTIDSSGNDVPFSDYTGKDIPLEDLGKLVRVGGVLTADNGGCGGSSICYTLTHGDKETVFRSNSDFVDVGTCVTFFGPLGSFDDAAQLNEVNYAWTYTN